MSATQQLGAVPATPPPPGMPEGEEEAPAAPRPKPYADAKGVFAKLIKLLPLATDEEAATFERRARRFTRRLGPLSLGRLVDDRQRPILWYACDHCVEIKILRRVHACSMAWRCRLLDGVAMPVPRRSTEPGRPRHRRGMT